MEQKEPIRELTKAELQLMNVLWNLKKATVYEMLDVMSDSQMAYSTASTFMRILVNKGFVAFESVGKSYYYYPIISREAYLDSFMVGVKNNFFSGSFRSMISFFAKKEKLTQAQFDSIFDILNENKKDKNG